MANKIKWNRMTDLPEFDYDIKHSKDRNRNHNMFEMDMIVSDYLGLQEKTNPNLVYKKEYREENTKHFKEPDEYNLEGIPQPVLEFDEFGNKTKWQEGYRRGLYVQDQGQGTIKTWMAYKNRPGLNKRIEEKEYDAFSDFE